MSELPNPSSSGGEVPLLRLVEWIPSDPESGVLRLRGEFPDRARAQPGAPVLVLRETTGLLTRRAPLNEASPEGAGWRAAYLIAGALLGGAAEKWLEWPDGARLTLPDVDVSAADGGVPVPPPERGAEVFDRAVLAERRAQRAESAQREQARTADAAVAALGALERRVEELTRERDTLARAQTTPVPTDDAAAPKVRLVVPEPEAGDPGAELRRELEAARTAQLEAEKRERRQRQALDEALGTLGRLRVQAAEVRLRMRIQMASASADAVRLAVLETERRGLRGRLHGLRAELDGLRARVAGAQAHARRLASELEDERSRSRDIAAEREELRRALDGERAARARAQQDLRSGRAAAQAHGARVAALEEALAEERARVDQESEVLKRRVAELGDELRAERSARASLGVQLRVARSSESAARAEAAARTAAQARLRREHAEALAEARTATAQLAASRASAQAPPDADARPSRPHRRLTELEAELADTRAALEEARARLRLAMLAASGRRAEQTSDDAGTHAEPAPEPPRGALSADAAALRRRVAVLQSAATRAEEFGGELAGPAPDPASVAARLDAAARSLRAAAPAEAVVETPVDKVGAGDAAPDIEAPARPVEPSRALTVRSSSELVVARPPSADSERAEPVLATGARRLPPLRGALVRLAAEDPFAAARLMAALLPAQGAFLHEDVDYDLTIRELGTFAVTVVSGRTTVRALHRPRSRRDAQMHLTVHALTLAELLAGRPRRVGRVLSPVRLRGSRRGLDVLAVLAQAGPSLADVARAGAVLDPALLIRVLPHLIGPADTEGHTFTVAQEVVDATTRTWYLTADGRHGLRVSTRAPGGGPDARVTMTRAALERLLRAEPLEGEHKPWIRGDFSAVEILRGWIDAARA